MRISSTSVEPPDSRESDQIADHRCLLVPDIEWAHCSFGPAHVSSVTNVPRSNWCTNSPGLERVGAA